MKFIDLTKPIIPIDTQVIFVADFFHNEIVGGAELTTAAIMSSSPYKTQTLKVEFLTEELIKANSDKLWIFGNCNSSNFFQLIPKIASTCHYVTCEYDYRFCRFRSLEKHEIDTKTICDCHVTQIGQLMSLLYKKSLMTWFMSEQQRRVFISKFPELEHKSCVLSSVFDQATLQKIQKLRENAPKKREKWIILGSSSWVKGTLSAEKYCTEHQLEYEIVGDYGTKNVIGALPYNKLLEKLSQSKGLIFTPAGADTCPRLVIEAKLLNCDLILNKNVQHADEEWFSTNNLTEIENYLRHSPARFWDNANKIMSKHMTISGYCTTYNCISQKYPFVECIKSMLEFCDEVCVVDGGSTDGTLNELIWLAYGAENCDCHFTMGLNAEACLRNKVHEPFEFPDEWCGIKRGKIRVKIKPRDWTSSQSALFDGMQKAEARNMCTGDFCWQLDVDEVVSEEDAKKIRPLCEQLKANAILGVSLPVVEFWGSSKQKVRLDIPPDKPRLSRNDPLVTHGVPLELRATDANGNLYCTGGSDGCDMVWKDTGDRVQFATFVTQDVVNVRMAASHGIEQARSMYEQWFNAQVDSLPGVFHYSWVDIERKIRLYRDFWTRHWEILYHTKYVDNAESNMFFDKPWSEVSDNDISQRARELETTGGHVFHRKWDGKITPWVTVSKQEPSLMRTHT